MTHTTPPPADNADDGAGTDDATTAAARDEHPLQRAHRFFQKAAPVIREVNDTIERHGGPEGVRDKVIERANELVQKVDEVVANATAIEGEVVEREPARGDGREARLRSTPPATPVVPRRSKRPYVVIGIVVAAATYGALRLQASRE